MTFSASESHTKKFQSLLTLLKTSYQASTTSSYLSSKPLSFKREENKRSINILQVNLFKPVKTSQGNKGAIAVNPNVCIWYKIYFICKMCNELSQTLGKLEIQVCVF